MTATLSTKAEAQMRTRIRDVLASAVVGGGVTFALCWVLANAAYWIVSLGKWPPLGAEASIEFISAGAGASMFCLGCSVSTGNEKKMYALLLGALALHLAPCIASLSFQFNPVVLGHIAGLLFGVAFAGIHILGPSFKSEWVPPDCVPLDERR